VIKFVSDFDIRISKLPSLSNAQNGITLSFLTGITVGSIMI